VPILALQGDGAGVGSSDTQAARAADVSNTQVSLPQLVKVTDFDVIRIAVDESEADTPLVVHGDGVLPCQPIVSMSRQDKTRKPLRT
jgi:hypothetical protein